MSSDSDSNENTCLSCFDDLDETNMVKYQINNNKTWLSSYYCETCVNYLINNSWKIFKDSVEKADCKKALNKILEVGPPINLRDKCGFPNPIDNNLLTEVDNILFCKENKITSAKLKDSLEGIEREKYINFLKNFEFK